MSNTDKISRIIVAVTGASGALYAKLLLDSLKQLLINGQVLEVGLVFSDNGQVVWHHELDVPIYGDPFKIYKINDYNAPFASGSSYYQTMIVCPCSMGTMARIAHGVSDNLITRAADVMIKERRKLILAIRETPVNIIHIKNMKQLTQSGVIIAPASPSFYSRPQSIEDLAYTVVDRLLQLSDLDVPKFRWGS